ncbi:MAG: hypothetical protein LBI54_03170, partial [Lachnospiraceae bacterium]|nr:hypothetical protein [Lachnospiraceae bacterium]
MPKQPPGFTLNPETGYFVAAGVDVAVFDDVYPEGRQSGLSIIMHGSRVATCGDLRFEPTPGQWQPVPKQDGRELNAAANTITVSCSYPDYERHLKGMNPMIYPDFAFSYTVTVKGAGESLIVTVDLDKPVPERFAGKLCFNLELFPGDLFGMPWIMDDRQGLFPPQPNGPVLVKKANIAHTLDYAPEGLYADVHRLAENSEFNPIIADDLVAAPYAVGRRLTIRPD